MAQRVTSVRFEAFTVGGNHRVSSQALNVFLANAEPLRVSSIKVNVFLTRAEPLRVSTFAATAWTSLEQGVYLPGEPFGGSEIFTPDFEAKVTFAAPPPPEVEVNPYQANTPNVDHQRIMREQHNFIQAGDSTFHWGVLTGIYATPEYTLGSLGRFYHDDLGMILARFCKFTGFVKTDSKGVPVGWAAAKRELWAVTNQFDKSTPDFAVGVAIPYNEAVYNGDCYGWVIVDGLVPVEMQVDFDSTPIMFGTEYGWSGDGRVKASAPGNSLGQRFTISKSPTLPVGSFKVELEKLSLYRLRGIITAQMAEQVESIEGLIPRVDQLETTVGGHTQAISALTERVDGIETRFSGEIQALSDALSQIRNLMPDGNYQDYVNAEITNLKNYVDANLTIVGTTANSALARANDAYALAQSIDGGSTQSQIDALNNSLGALTTRLVGFTVVIDMDVFTDGQVLVSQADGTSPGGNPIYNFYPVDFKLGSLGDTDLITTPPVDGDALVYDGVSGKWVPYALGGGLSDAPSDGTLYGRKNAAWEAVPSGGGGTAWTLVASTTVSTAVSSVVFNNLGAYAEIAVIARGWTHSTNVQRIIQLSSDNGSSWDQTAANYPISLEDGNDGLPGIGGFFPSTTVTTTGRGFAVQIQNFNQATMKWLAGSIRNGFRFYTNPAACDALRCVGVASNVLSGNLTAGTFTVFGR